jgi:ATP-dependent Clp protease protease subunit
MKRSILKKHEHDTDDSIGIPMPGYTETYIKLAKDRVIFLAEDVSLETASSLTALLLYYDNEEPGEPITLYIHSNGGDVSGLSHIYDVMQMISSPIQTVCLGKCYSAGAVILAAGTKGERYCFKHSKIMIHGIQCAFPILGHDQINSKTYYDFLKDNNDNIMKILAHHTGQSLSKIKQDCVRDVWLSANQAKDYNLIDYIL